eukprot:scaffold92450_cov22-Prasinocladus_malaysianus.AAC.1
MMCSTLNDMTGPGRMYLMAALIHRLEDGRRQTEDSSRITRTYQYFFRGNMIDAEVTTIPLLKRVTHGIELS